MKDTARMRAIQAHDIIHDYDLNKSNKKSGNKTARFGAIVNIFGLLLFTIMLVIVSFNFSRDARILEKPLLTAEKSAANGGKADNGASIGEVDGTIKYNKSSGNSTGSGSKSTSPGSNNTGSGSKSAVGSDNDEKTTGKSNGADETQGTGASQETAVATPTPTPEP